jgi:tRNA modification GTPase
MFLGNKETIVALSTPQGIGAIGVLRLSGDKSIAITDQIFKGALLQDAKSHTLHFGTIHKQDLTILDEVVVGVFKNPKSYTGEDIIEISCHGSPYIIEQVLNLCIEQGARLAFAGEFTQRAFLNGKLDLSQAEAVADLIASENTAQHKMAWQQLRGGYAKELQSLRERLINFAALIELELDFSQEDVEFVDRSALEKLLIELQTRLHLLADSFRYGNAIKKGIPVAIIGKPNAGKSTLLNALLNEDKAIVSDIAGTTRDVIEDVITIDGIAYRFIDTAGLRATTDIIENLGIEKTLQKSKEADIILLIVEATDSLDEIVSQYKNIPLEKEQDLIILINKSDDLGICNAYDVEEAIMTITKKTALAISAKNKIHIDKIPKILAASIKKSNTIQEDIIVSNQRHFQAIKATLTTIEELQIAMKEGLSGDLISVDIRSALKTLGSITGEVEIDRDILGTIFGKFCIGK